MRIWIASLFFYAIIFAFCELLRFFVGRIFCKNAKIPAFFGVDLKTILLEFIGTVQVCAPMFDVNAVLEHYGLAGVLVEIALIELCNAFLLRDALADPCQLFGRYTKLRCSALCVVILLGIQFIAAYASYLIALAFWRMEFHSAHAPYYRNEHCETDLTVTILYGSLVEAGGLLTFKLAELVLERSELDSMSLRFLSAIVSGVITVFGIGLTGMYANPIVAWACTFNCGDVPYLAHFVVYWLAPLSAFMFADRFISS